MKTFILYDESQPNADGSRILLDGLRLSRFKKNPVMLYMHRRAEENSSAGSEVIGRWEKVRMDGKRLVADAVFDSKDALAQKIAQKVQDGFLRAASIGIDVHKLQQETKDKPKQATQYTITESTLLEASIVDIPKNENALAHAASSYHTYRITNSLGEVKKVKKGEVKKGDVKKMKKTPEEPTRQTHAESTPKQVLPTSPTQDQKQTQEQDQEQTQEQDPRTDPRTNFIVAQTLDWTCRALLCLCHSQRLAE